MAHKTLLIDCPDEPRLVHRITGVLANHGGNIVANAEFVDASAGWFFMRTELDVDADPAAMREELAGELPNGARVTFAEKRPKDAVVLVTKEPHCLGDLLVRDAYRELPIRIRAVVGNHATLAPLAHRFGIPFHHVPVDGRERPEHEAALEAALAPYEPDYLVLAKYMRVLTGDFVGRYAGRVINIHHSFLPAFQGAAPYRQAWDRGVKIVGATAHFATADLDAGPIIAQDVVPIDHSHGPDEIAQAGRDVEKVALARALRLVLQDRVFVSGNRTVIFD